MFKPTIIFFVWILAINQIPEEQLLLICILIKLFILYNSVLSGKFVKEAGKTRRFLPYNTTNVQTRDNNKPKTIVQKQIFFVQKRQNASFLSNHIKDFKVCFHIFINKNYVYINILIFSVAGQSSHWRGNCINIFQAQKLWKNPDLKGIFLKYLNSSEKLPSLASILIFGSCTIQLNYNPDLLQV